ncbi:MAG: HlyD family efflux transporter periplasmic adaptor subunit [Peptostreptococcaceae bacterium]
MRKIKYSNVVIIGIFIYILFQIATMIIGKNTSTIVLEHETLEEKINIKGVFIRDEYLVKAEQDGNVEIKIENGEKVKNNQVIASIYKDGNSSIENNKEIEVLNQEIQKLENEKDNIITKTQLKTKKEQKKILENQNKKNTTNVSSQSSGIVSYEYDGNEEFYNLDILDNLTKNDIENTQNEYKSISDNSNKVKEGQPIARVINGYSTYIGVCVDKDTTKHFEVDQNIKIKLNTELINAKVDRIYKNNSENIIILKITNQNVEIYDTRVKEFDIIYKQIEGIRIPKECIKIVDKKKGVYVVNQQTTKPEFVELKGIEYENKDYVFIDYYKNDKEGIKTVDLYDEIISKPNSINKNVKMK